MLCKENTQEKKQKYELQERVFPKVRNQNPSLKHIKRYDQKTLYEGFGIPTPEEPGDPGLTQIVASGDELIDKEEGMLRWSLSLQNPNGIRLQDNGGVMPEMAAMERLQIDVASFPESNKLATATPA